ncbi:MAG TPA: dihydropteroate synthase [Candidatus Limnocylindria bacterium]
MELRWGERTWVMGIINLTPDSFSGDGLAPPGRSVDEVVEAALRQGRAFVDAGAQILDVGAESSRPAQFYGDHPPLSAEDEAALAVPVVAALVAELGGRTLVSIDTTKGPVARQAVAAGAAIINDVWAGRHDPDTVRAAAETGVHLVLMHNRTVADYAGEVTGEVTTWLRAAVDDALAAGVRRERILVDPGIGFGKTPEHSLAVLRGLARLKADLGGLPLLVGTSRKRFIGALLDGAGPDERLEGTIATVVLAIAQGADVVRVHDVGPVARAVRVTDAIVRGGAEVTA